jgi:hypothetical protein
MQALDAYLNLPIQKWPDWVLASRILGRRVTPAEMQSLERDDAFWRRIEETARTDKKAAKATRSSAGEAQGLRAGPKSG